MRSRRLRRGACLVLPGALVAITTAQMGGWSSASAQVIGAPLPASRQEVGLPASSLPAPLQAIGFDQRLGEPLPLDVSLADEDGRLRPLGDFFGTRPVVLAFVYFECPMLCTQVVRSLTATLRTLSLDVGRDFDVLVVSFDSREGPAVAARAKSEQLAHYARSGTESGWHFLTGGSESIARLTRAAGFRYTWDEATGQFAHPAGVIVVTPDGRPARYLFGIDFSGRDLRLALVESSQGRIGSPVDRVLLFCYHYDPMTGRYGLYIMRALRVAGVATVLALGSIILILLNRERFTRRTMRL